MDNNYVAMNVIMYIYGTLRPTHVMCPVPWSHSLGHAALNLNNGMWHWFDFHG